MTLQTTAVGEAFATAVLSELRQSNDVGLMSYRGPVDDLPGNLHWRAEGYQGKVDVYGRLGI
jgi:hypothetical protein